MFGRVVVVVQLVLVGLVASAGADTQGKVGLLPIRSRWAPPTEVVLVSDALSELGAELGLEILPIDGDSKTCWRDDACYVRTAATAGTDLVLAVEVIKTSSRRLHLAIRLIDNATRSVKTFGVVRSQPGVLRAQLRSTVIAIRDAIPQREPEPPPPLPPVPVEPPIVVPPTPAPAPAITPAPTPWYQSISVNAFVSAAYTYNPGRPPSSTNALRVFDTSDNTGTIDVAELVIQRAVGEKGDAGFRIDLVAGSAIPRVSASAGLFRDSAGVGSDFDLQQGFVSYIAPLGRGLRFDAGKFATPAGAEVIEGFDGFNDQYSRSILFGYAIPFTHTGIKVGYPFSDRVSATLLGTNGWDVVRDNNTSLSFGAQLTILPLTDLTIAVTYLGGPERTANDEVMRHLGDLVATWKLGHEIVVAANLDYARDGGTDWYGAAGYLRIDLAPKLAVALRAERFWDLDGVRTGAPQRLWELTLTSAFRLAPGFTFRIEARFDHSGEPVFPSADGDRRSQATIAGNAVYAL